MSRVFSIAEGLENLGALRTGGQGSVYKARRGETISAVKILPTPIHVESIDDKNYRDFQNEVSKLKKVNEDPNPHVVKILSSGISESGSLPYIEMEFIEGPDLADLIQEPNDKTFARHETIRVAEQLSSALAHCHKVGVKHGDIKSNNVKLNLTTDNYILLDFGLSIMSDEQRRTSLRHAGAIEFMAPEQNDGEMLFESDVYSFGIILFELLAGVVPFPLNNKSETSRNAVMISHMEEEVPDVLALRRLNIPAFWDDERKKSEMEVPNWLLAVIAKCLEKRPEDRFRNGIELHESITNSITSKAIFAYTPAVKMHDKSHVTIQTPNSIPNRFESGESKAFSRPKALVLGAIGLLILFALYSGYSLLRKPEVSPLDSTTSIADNQVLKDSLAKLESQRISDSINAAERLRAQQVNATAVNNTSVSALPTRRGNGKGNSKGKGRGKKNK